MTGKAVDRESVPLLAQQEVLGIKEAFENLRNSKARLEREELHNAFLASKLGVGNDELPDLAEKWAKERRYRS